MRSRKRRFWNATVVTANMIVLGFLAWLALAPLGHWLFFAQRFYSEK